MFESGVDGEQFALAVMQNQDHDELLDTRLLLSITDTIRSPLRWDIGVDQRQFGETCFGPRNTFAIQHLQHRYMSSDIYFSAIGTPSLSRLYPID